MNSDGLTAISDLNLRILNIFPLLRNSSIFRCRHTNGIMSFQSCRYQHTQDISPFHNMYTPWLRIRLCEAGTFRFLRNQSIE